MLGQRLTRADTLMYVNSVTSDEMTLTRRSDRVPLEVSKSLS